MKKGFLPSCLLTCFSFLLSAGKRETVRPNCNLKIGKATVRALFDTGSTVTLCHSRYLKDMPSNRHRQDHLLPMPDLKSANGSSLNVVDVKTVPISIKPGQSSSHRVYFVQNLQVPAIIGMDYMSTNHLIIDTKHLKIHFPDHGTPPDNISDYSVNVMSKKEVSIAPMEEAKVSFEIPLT